MVYTNVERGSLPVSCTKYQARQPLYTHEQYSVRTVLHMGMGHIAKNVSLSHRQIDTSPKK